MLLHDVTHSIPREAKHWSQGPDISQGGPDIQLSGKKENEKNNDQVISLYLYKLLEGAKQRNYNLVFIFYKLLGGAKQNWLLVCIWTSFLWICQMFLLCLQIKIVAWSDEMEVQMQLLLGVSSQ